MLVDVIFLARTRNSQHKAMTQAAIDSCIAGAGSTPVRVTVVEQTPSYSYSGVNLIRDSSPFNFNRFANNAIRQTNGQFIVVANTDLTFEDGWLQPLLDANHPVVSPADPKVQGNFSQNTVGDQISQHFSGWCFMISRELFEQIGGFDDCVSFWCSDNVVVEQVKAVGILPMVVPASRVHHKISRTLVTVAKPDDLTWKQVYIFNQAYGKTLGEDNPRYLAWKRKVGL
jgi:hypothetical protein